jgi:Pro-kumamolisin, activation domain/Divergent InlB B-repeat domain
MSSMCRLTITFAVVLCGLGAWLALEPSYAQTSAGPARPMITQPIVETSLVRLFGNVRPEANTANDRGRVPDSLPMEHMFLQLQRPAAQEQALKQLIDQLHDRRSPNFHRWLTPSQFGAQFGPAPADIERITTWLRSHGFTVNVVYPSGMTIDFSGTTGQVFAAFHTEIHYIEAQGATHIANMRDPQIPAALAPAIIGVVSLNNFVPRPRLVARRKPNYTAACGTGSTATCYEVTPPDLATIYNFNPVFNSGNTGQSQTIYLIEDTDLYSTGDWTTFRSAFGLSGYTGATLSTVNPAPPSGTNNCSDPGVNSDDGEAILDAEYASAAAPSAAIVIATCANSPDGVLIAIQNLINSASPPAIISISYGACEASNGASSNAAYNAIYQQGVAEGTSIFVAAGDEGAAECDYEMSNVTHGIAVNALASTPYNVAVGGTDFGDIYAGTSSTYWNSTNTATYGSAKSYIPEIPWNDTCASQLIATYEGFTTTYGSAGFCNSATGETLLEPGAGGGGPSGCATGAPTISGVVSGTCAGYAKPSWQSGVIGIPNDGVRDLPDVSLFAANGLWSHYYVFCYSDPTSGYGGAPCTGAPSGWSAAAGTSFATPIMAGIQALVNNNAGGPQGNPNYQYYSLAANEYGVSGSSTCNSSLGNAVGSLCIFYDVTLGDIDTACTGSYNCYIPAGTYGVLSTSSSSYLPAYPATTGWDFATGIGTVNVSNLVMNWPGAPALQVTPSTNIAASGTQGGPFSPPSFGYTLSATSGSINFSISGVPSWLTPSATSGTASSGTTVTFTVNANANSLLANTYPATITFTDAGGGRGTQTRTATLTVNPPGLQVTPSTNIAASGQQGGPFTPPSFSYSLSAVTGSLKYSITNVPSWLTASPTSGTVTTKATSVTFKINTSAADKLSASTYVSSINFNDNTNNQVTTRVATLTVTPKEYTIKVSASPSADGTVSGGGTFLGGTSETVTATPNSGHAFLHWTENGKVVSTSESYTFTVSANATLVADFAALKEYTIKVSASPSADGTVSGGGTFVGGTSETVTATPNSGYTFVHWTENGRVVSTSESYTFTLNANVTLVADFSKSQAAMR